jgi:cyclic-di-GMP-binding protein
MAGNFSFDVVSDYDKAELNNVVDQAQREIANRYDLKDTKAKIDWEDEKKTSLKITGDNNFHIEAIEDILRKKLAIRGQSQKVLDTSHEPATNNFQMTKIVPLKRGLDQDKAKKIANLVRDTYPKVKTQIQGEELRVFSPKKDELQAVMDLLRQQDYDFPLQFTNYR